MAAPPPADPAQGETPVFVQKAALKKHIAQSFTNEPVAPAGAATRRLIESLGSGDAIDCCE
ncbi:MAG: hypothetical protein K0R45_2084 [Pseudomonas sp.]|jgi:hypothetical protein|nr:hypothetical protein [Pseudomonas sp.]